MTHFRLPITLQLAPGEALRWTQRPAVRIQVLSGCIWLTHVGDLQDRFLQVGQCCTLRREAGSVIGAEGPVSVRIEAAGSPWPQVAAAVARAVKAAIGSRIKGPATAAAGATEPAPAGGIIFR